MSRPKVYGERVAAVVRLPVDLHRRLIAETQRRDLALNKALEVGALMWLEQREGKEL